MSKEIPIVDVLFDAWLFQVRSRELLEKEFDQIRDILTAMKHAWLQDNPDAEKLRPELFD